MQNKALLKSPLPDRLSSALIFSAFPRQSILGNIFVGWCDGFVVGKLGSPGSTLTVGGYQGPIRSVKYNLMLENYCFPKQRNMVCSWVALVRP